MRILQIVTLSELGGAQSVVKELANGACREGHTVAVMANPGGKLWDALDPGVERQPCAHFRRQPHPISDPLAILAVRETARNFKPDIVHLHSSKAGAWGRIGLPRLRERIVYTVHGFDTILKANRAFLGLERRLARRCGAIVPVSGYDEARMREEGFSKLSPIANGIADPLAESARPDPFEASRRAGRKVVLCVARLKAPKRYDLFAGAAKALADKNVDFYWVGNASRAPSGPANLAALGEIEGAGRLFRHADLAVLPSDYEGSPISVIEAMACGRPCVASAVGDIPNLLRGGPGVVVPNEVDAFASAIADYLQNPYAAVAAGRFARQRYLERYTVGSMLKAYFDLYGSLLGETSRQLNAEGSTP